MINILIIVYKNKLFYEQNNICYKTKIKKNKSKDKKSNKIQSMFTNQDNLKTAVKNTNFKISKDTIYISKILQFQQKSFNY